MSDTLIDAKLQLHFLYLKFKNCSVNLLFDFACFTVKRHPQQVHLAKEMEASLSKVSILPTCRLEVHSEQQKKNTRKCSAMTEFIANNAK